MGEITSILLSALGVLVTGLVSFAVAKLTKYFDEKIENEKAQKFMYVLTDLVADCVQETYQTYVEALKEAGKFDKEAQKEALNRCVNKIKSQMAPALITYVTTNFGDLTEYLISLIESRIYMLKK